MVRARLRALERRLVMERAELQLEGLVHNLLLEWDTAIHFSWAIPDPMDFIRNVIDQGFFFRSNVRALSYLEEFKREGMLPDERRLLQILMPWYR